MSGRKLLSKGQRRRRKARKAQRWRFSPSKPWPPLDYAVDHLERMMRAEIARSMALPAGVVRSDWTTPPA